MALYCKIGGRESDSFVTDAEAKVLLKSLAIDTSEWFSLNTSGREYRLRMAAQVFNLLPLRGRRVFCGQALAFPRTGQENVHSIPDEVKLAQVEIALNVIHRALLSYPPVEDGAVSGSRVTQVSLGGLLMVSFSGESESSGNPLDRIARNISFTTYTALSRWFSQMRGRGVGEEFTCSTTTTTTSTTSTTTTTT